jgi:hypothetical protein
MKIPKVGLILEYQNVFDQPIPKDRIDLLKKNDISKIEVLARLCLINSMLSPRLSVRFDYSKSTQENILDKIISIDKNHPAIPLIKRKLDEKSIIFNRPANLFAIMEILNSDLRDGYLCVNRATNEVNDDHDTENPDLETLNASLIAYNELFENVDPIHIAYRGKRLFEYLAENEIYGNSFKEYIHQISGTDLKGYLVEVLSIAFSQNSTAEEFNYYYKLEEENQLFNSFSERTVPISIGNQQEALDIRKSPIYRVDQNSFMLMDKAFLVEKCFNLIIWDFLFEKLLKDADSSKRSAIIKSYRSVIGYFFEDYVREKITNGLHYLQHPKPRLFDDLKVNGVELGDVYIQQNKKILLAEVKSSGIPSKSKYGESLSDLYDHDKPKFFKTHGLDQLVTNLENLMQNPKDYNPKLDLKKRHTIFPVIITNEVLLTLGFTIHVFNKEFDQRFDRTKYPSQDIKPLMILHTSDLDFLEEYLKDKSINLFDFLTNHIAKFRFIPKLPMSYDTMRPRHNGNIGKLIFGEKQTN